MGAWGEGMQANDTALDAIGDLEDRISGKKWEERRDEAILPQAAQDWVAKNGLDAAFALGYGNAGKLGIADFLLDKGVSIPIEKIDPIIQDELSEDQLDCWTSSSTRREALELFRLKVLGEADDLAQELLSHHNRGLFTRIAEGN